MDISLDKNILRQQKLFIGTPMYGGMCSGMFTRSMIDLSVLCMRELINFQPYFLFNESLITRARNYICDEFMRSDATHLLFIDADIGFDARDVFALLILSVKYPEFDIIGAPYPKKCIAWEKIKQAVDKGMADDNPNNLDRYVGDYVFNPKAGTVQFAIREPVEVLEIGTGFMMIRRETMNKFKDAFFEQYKYRPDHARTEHFDGSRHIMQYFQAEIDPKSERYLSEDYWFTQKAQSIGLRTWLCPWMKLSHMGSFIFGGSLADLASIGANPTVGDQILKKKKK